jgi:hypothetical protein
VAVRGGGQPPVPTADAPPDTAEQIARDQLALSELQTLIGDWKGVGQPTRGSARGAWAEEAAWAWDFEHGRAAVVFTATGSRYLASGRILPGAEPGELLLHVWLPAADAAVAHTRSRDRGEKTGAEQEGDAPAEAALGPQAVYRGRYEEGRWVFTRTEKERGRDADHAAVVAAAPARISLRLVAEGKRLVVLLERRLGGSDRFARLAEIGYTRKGSGFGQGGGTGPECIVTGGLGTIAVEYAGQTYYVCCTGCRDYFLENPQQVLAQYRQRKEQPAQAP